MKAFFTQYQIPENSPPNFKYLTQAAAFYRRQLLAMYEGVDLSMEQPDKETGVHLVDIPAPQPPQESSGGWFSSAKSLWGTATSYASSATSVAGSYASSAASYAQDYANDLIDTTHGFVSSSPTVQYVESAVSSTLSSVSDKVEGVMNPLLGLSPSTERDVELDDIPAPRIEEPLDDEIRPVPEPDGPAEASQFDPLNVAQKAEDLKSD